MPDALIGALIVGGVFVFVLTIHLAGSPRRRR